MGKLLDKFGKWVGDKLIEHARRNIKRMSQPRINQLLGDFNDEIPKPTFGGFAGDDDIGRKPRTHHLNMEDIDEINVSIRLANGQVGQLTIRGQTLAQIIFDRNGIAQQPTEVISQPSADEGIDVGDGLPPEEPQPARISPVESAEMIKAAERLKRLQMQNAAKPLPPGVPLPRQKPRLTNLKDLTG